MLNLNSEKWINIQNAFHNANTIKVSGENREWPMITFNVGPFKIAYPDFICGREQIDEEYINHTISEAENIGVDVIRFQGGALTLKDGAKYIVNQGTIKIEDLHFWRNNQTEKARRTRNKMLKTHVCIRKGKTSDGPAIYAMYCNTITRHNGSLRYSQEYFTALSPEAAWIATIDDIPCAFVCIGYQGSRGVYLHGGHEPWAKQYYPNDLLYLFMLDMAYEKKLSSFDFLPSPKSQPNLVHYKKSWGGENNNFEVTDVILTPIKGKILTFSMKVVNLFSSAQKHIHSKNKA